MKKRLTQLSADMRQIAEHSSHTNHKYEICGRCMARRALGEDVDERYIRLPPQESSDGAPNEMDQRHLHWLTAQHIAKALEADGGFVVIADLDNDPHVYPAQEGVGWETLEVLVGTQPWTLLLRPGAMSP